MILITGASGQLGSQIVTETLNYVGADQLAVSVTDTQKVEHLKTRGIDVRQANFADQSSMYNAFGGVDKVLLISAPTPDGMKLQENVIQAACDAGVRHLLYTSFCASTEDAVTEISRLHYHTEQVIQRSGLTYTIVRNGLYVFALDMFLQGALATGVLRASAGDRKTAFMTHEDLATFIAKVLTGDGHENRCYTPNGELSDFTEIAAAISDVYATPIRYEVVAPDLIMADLKAAGMPEEVAVMAAQFNRALALGEFEIPSADFAKIVGRKPADLHEILSSIKASN